jgi:hypothetical protein
MSIVEAIIIFAVATTLVILSWRRANPQTRVILLALLLEAFMTAVAVVRRHKGIKKG